MPDNLQLTYQHLEDDRLVPGKAVLDLQSIAFDADMNELLPANHRWLCWHGEELIAHAAVQRRWFVIRRAYLEGWMLGGVCTEPQYQRQGVARRLLAQVHEDLSMGPLHFIVLNCGNRVRRFYEKIEYKEVSPHGLYLRNGSIEIDNDPALARVLSPELDTDRLRCEAFPFVNDF